MPIEILEPEIPSTPLSGRTIVGAPRTGSIIAETGAITLPRTFGGWLRLFLTRGVGVPEEQASSFTTRLKNLFPSGPSQVTRYRPNPAYTDTTIPPPKGFPTKAAITGTTILGGGTLVYLTASNPNLNKTLQANAGAIKTLADSLKDITKTTSSFSEFLTKNPLLLVGGLILIGIVVLKK